MRIMPSTRNIEEIFFNDPSSDLSDKNSINITGNKCIKLTIDKLGVGRKKHN